MKILEKIFDLKNNNTTIKTEIIAGITTFFTMSYLFVISPKILSSIGLDFGQLITVTAITVFVCSLVMAFIANKPYAVAPFIGETAFIAYTLVAVLGFSVQSIYSAIFISGILILLMSLFNIRMYIIEKIPECIKVSFCSGLGLFFMSIALKDIGIIDLVSHSNKIQVIDIIHSLFAVFCLILLITLTHKKKKMAIIISMLVVTLLGIIFDDVQLPTKIISLPANMLPAMFQFDFAAVFTKEFVPVFILVFLLANIDTAGAIVTLSEEKDSYKLKKTMIADSLSVILSPMFGTTTSGAYVDSMTGMSLGGKTGLTALTVGVLFLIGMLFTPIIMIIPSYAYAPVLFYVGMLLAKNIKNINFNDITEYVPALFTIALMIFTNNIGIGILSGFFVYPLIQLLTKQFNKTNLVQWSLFVISILFFIIYPY